MEDEKLPKIEPVPDTPQCVAIQTLMDLAQNSINEETRLEAARLLLDRG